MSWSAERASGMLVRANNGAVHEVRPPVDLSTLIGLALQRLEDPTPHASQCWSEDRIRLVAEQRRESVPAPSAMSRAMHEHGGGVPSRRSPHRLTHCAERQDCRRHDHFATRHVRTVRRHADLRETWTREFGRFGKLLGSF